MENNKKVPELRFKGFSEEWKQCELRNACTIKTGYPFDSIDFSEDGIFRVITNVNIQDNSATVDNSLGNRVNIYDKQLIEEYVLKTGDILVTMDGTVGRTAKVADHHMVLAQRVGRLIANGDTEFVYQLLNVGSFYKRMAITSVGGTIKHISLSDIGNYTTSIPTNYLEQKAIGNYFQNIDKLIETNQSKFDKLKNIKKACLEKMFPKSGATIPELRFKGFTEEWEEKKLGEIVSITMGQSPNGKNYTDNPEDSILVQGNADMKKGIVIPRVWTKQVTKIANAGDLIMSVRAPVGDIGKTFYDIVIGRGVAAVKGNEFIFQALKKINNDGFWKQYSAGSTFESISSAAIKNALILFPTEKEQEKIGTYFKNLDDLISKTEQRLNKLKNIKKACLEKMFVNMEDTI